jgi:hypothetical protein
MNDSLNERLVLRYLTLSALARPSPACHGQPAQIEQMVRQHFTDQFCIPWHAEHPAWQLSGVGRTTGICAVMMSAANLAPLMHRLGLDVLVVDTLVTLRQQEIPAFCNALQSIWRSGIDVCLPTEDRLVSFASMGDIVTTSDFIAIYVRSLWTEASASDTPDAPSRRDNPARLDVVSPLKRSWRLLQARARQLPLATRGTR